MNETVIWTFLGVLNLQKILGNICISERIFYRKQSLAVAEVSLYQVFFFDIFHYYWGKELYKGLRLYSLLRKIYHFSVTFTGSVLADKSMKLRIFIIDMFRFKLQLQKLKVPPRFLFQNGIFFRGIIWVSKFFVTQSRFAIGSGLLSKNVKQDKMFSFHSLNDLFHEK